jgi:hypothetical protein
MYDNIESIIASVLSGLEIQEDVKAFDKALPYNGEFDSYTLPEEYRPNATNYAFVKCVNGRSVYTTSANPRNTGRDIQIVIFVGSFSRDREDAKSNVYARMDLVMKALQAKPVTEGDEQKEIGRLYHETDEWQFGIPNHVCWAQVFNLKIPYIKL